MLIFGPDLFSHSPAQPTANSPKSIFHIIKMFHQASVLLSVVFLFLFNYFIWTPSYVKVIPTALQPLHFVGIYNKWPFLILQNIGCMRHSKTPNIDSNQKHGLKTTFMCQMASNDVGKYQCDILWR